MRYLLSSLEGLEPVVAQDALALGARKAEPRRGRVLVEADDDFLYAANLAHPTTGRVVLVLSQATVASLDDIKKSIYDIDWPAVFAPSRSFACAALRVGEHPFTSLDVERAAGEAVIRGMESATGERPKVDLRAADVEIAIELHGDELTVGVATSGEALHRRPWRVYQHRAPLAGGLASALVALSGWRGEGLLLDPCCGSGTIPIEADHRLRRVPVNAARPSWPFERLRAFDAAAFARVRERLLALARAEGAPLQGNEQYAKHLDGAVRNAQAAGVGAWAAWTGRDFNHLERPEGLTHVVANPPWGLRVTSRKVSDRIGRELRARLDHWAEGGALTAVVLVGNRRFEKNGAPPAEARDVMNGGVPCRVLRYELG